jgi:deoxyribonucleoside regulator
METNKLELLANIASWYFEENLTQTEIARRTGYSPSMISRLLTEARNSGVVEIRIHHPIPRRVDLEQALAHKLGLKQVRVVACGKIEHSQMLRRLGNMAARLVEQKAHDNMTIGVSWGSAVYETVTALRIGSDQGINVLLMMGSLDTENPEISGPVVTQQLARALMGRYSILPAPLMVDSESTRQTLLNDSRVRRVLEQFRNIELALVGVGSNEPEHSALLNAGYLTIEQSKELARAGAVGDVCAIFFDKDGKLVDNPVTRCVVGISASDLASIPTVIGVSGGKFKILPIIGASRAGLINLLVTDDVTAQGILETLNGE